MASLLGKKKTLTTLQKAELLREKNRLEREKMEAEMARLKEEREAREKIERVARDKHERRLEREARLRSREAARKEDLRVKSEAMQRVIGELDKLSTSDGLAQPTGHISEYRVQSSTWGEAPQAQNTSRRTIDRRTWAHGRQAAQEEFHGTQEHQNSLYPGRRSSCLTPNCTSPEATIQLSGYCVDCNFRRTRSDPASKSKGKSRFSANLTTYLGDDPKHGGSVKNDLGQYDDPEFEAWAASQLQNPKSKKQTS